MTFFSFTFFLFLPPCPHRAGMLLQCWMMTNTSYFEKRMEKGRMGCDIWLDSVLALCAEGQLNWSAEVIRISYKHTVLNASKFSGRKFFCTKWRVNLRCRIKVGGESREEVGRIWNWHRVWGSHLYSWGVLAWHLGVASLLFFPGSFTLYGI